MMIVLRSTFPVAVAALLASILFASHALAVRPTEIEPGRRGESSSWLQAAKESIAKRVLGTQEKRTRKGDVTDTPPPAPPGKEEAAVDSGKQFGDATDTPPPAPPGNEEAAVDIGKLEEALDAVGPALEKADKNANQAVTAAGVWATTPHEFGEHVKALGEAVNKAQDYVKTQNAAVVTDVKAPAAEVLSKLESEGVGMLQGSGAYTPAKQGDSTAAEAKDDVRIAKQGDSAAAMSTPDTVSDGNKGKGMVLFETCPACGEETDPKSCYASCMPSCPHGPDDPACLEAFTAKHCMACYDCLKEHF